MDILITPLEQLEATRYLVEGARRTTTLAHVHKMLRAGKAALELTFPMLPKREYRPQAMCDCLIRFIQGSASIQELQLYGRVCLNAQQARLTEPYPPIARILFAAVKLSHLFSCHGDLYTIRTKDVIEFIGWLHPLNPGGTQEGQHDWEMRLNEAVRGILSKK